MLTVPRRLLTPERLYVVALGLTGSAALVSVWLAPAERGELSANMVSATMGAAIGGFSLDTFLLSRPSGWVLSRGRTWVLTMLSGGLLLSAAVAAALIVVAGLGSFAIGIGAATALTVFNAASSLALRRQRFWLVYSTRAAVGVVLVAGYALLYAGGHPDGGRWSLMWLLAQTFGAAVLCVVVAGWARRDRTPPPTTATGPEYRADVAALGKLHIGVCAQMVTYRLDQILLARFAGAGALGVYSLAVAALEFAQARAVVRAQRILADRDRRSGSDGVGGLIRATLPVAVAAVAGLAVLGLVRSEYRHAWLIGLCLLPGTLAVAAGKTWSARLLIDRGEQATTTVALLTMVVAVVSYVLLIPWAGAFGAAVAATCAYGAYAVGSRRGLRREPHLMGERAG